MILDPGSPGQAWAQEARTTAPLATVLPHNQMGLSMNRYGIFSYSGVLTPVLLHFSPVSLDVSLPACLPMMAAKIYWPLAMCQVLLYVLYMFELMQSSPPCDTEIIYQNGISS